MSIIDGTAVKIVVSKFVVVIEIVTIHLWVHFYARQHICYSASLRQRRVRLSHAGIVPSRAKAGS